MDDKSIKMIYHYNCNYKIEKNKYNKYDIYTYKKSITKYAFLYYFCFASIVIVLLQYFVALSNS